MKGKIFVALFLLAPLLASAAVVKIKVDAPIHPVTSEYIVKSLEKADREGADLLILTLDTPGGLDTSMREIIEKIVNAKTPVAAFVGPSGSRAASAGFFIALACDVFVMAPGTSTGSAHPVGISLTGQSMDPTMAEKVTNDAAAYIRTLAGKRGRNVRMAEDAVRKSLSYTEKEALEGGLIDFAAGSEEDIVARLDGRTIKRFDGSEQTLALAGQADRRMAHDLPAEVPPDRRQPEPRLHPAHDRAPRPLLRVLPSRGHPARASSGASRSSWPSSPSRSCPSIMSAWASSSWPSSSSFSRSRSRASACWPSEGSPP